MGRQEIFPEELTSELGLEPGAGVTGERRGRRLSQASGSALAKA